MPTEAEKKDAERRRRRRRQRERASQAARETSSDVNNTNLRSLLIEVLEEDERQAAGN